MQVILSDMFVPHRRASEVVLIVSGRQDYVMGTDVRLLTHQSFARTSDFFAPESGARV